MKIISILITMALVAGNAYAAEQTASSVRAGVSSKATTDYGNNESKTQERKLVITLTNTGKSEIKALSIRWTMYGHHLKNRDLVKLEQGEMKAQLELSETKTLESKTVKIKSQRETTVRVPSKGNKNRNNKAQAKVKKIPASGSTYYGYAVTVYDGKTIIASEYSHPSIKELESAK